MGGPVVRLFRDRRATTAIVGSVLLVLTLGLPTHAGPLSAGEETFPDLVPNVTEVYVYRTSVLDPVTNTFVLGPNELSFDTWSQNLGTVALDLVADDPTDFMNTTVSQCVRWPAPAVCEERRQVGGFAWHDEHTHFHYQDFGAYELRRMGSGGTIDYSAAGLVDTSDKVSFCLLDSERVDTSADPAPTYVFCTPARQGISPGWTDIYTSDLDGQQFSLAGLTDGRYAIVVTQDYNNTIYESDDTNNRVEVIIDLTDLATAIPQVEVVEHRWPSLGGGSTTTTSTTTSTTTTTIADEDDDKPKKEKGPKKEKQSQRS